MGAMTHRVTVPGRPVAPFQPAPAPAHPPRPAPRPPAGRAADAAQELDDAERALTRARAQLED